MCGADCGSKHLRRVRRNDGCSVAGRRGGRRWRVRVRMRRLVTSILFVTRSPIKTHHKYTRTAPQNKREYSSQPSPCHHFTFTRPSPLTRERRTQPNIDNRRSRLSRLPSGTSLSLTRCPCKLASAQGACAACPGWRRAHWSRRCLHPLQNPRAASPSIAARAGRRGCPSHRAGARSHAH